jgi:hypothetical protein
LAALIAGAVLPVQGSADLEGVPIARWQRAAGDPPIGYLPDEPMLIEGTVHQNIARFRDTSLMAVASRRCARPRRWPLCRPATTRPSATTVAPRPARAAAVAFARAVHGSRAWWC